MEFKRPQKAPTESIRLDQVIYPILASYKLDGIRGATVNGEMRSNTMTRTPSQVAQNMADLIRIHTPFIVDGELVVKPYHRDEGDHAARNADEGQIYRESMSAVQTGSSLVPLTFFVFDLFSNNPYIRRLEGLRKIVDGLHKDIVVIEQREIHNEDDLLEFESQAIDRGYEGLMLRTFSGQYKAGRCTLKEYNIFKFVRHVELQAEVLGVYERMHNANEALEDNFGNTKRSTHQANKVGLGTLGGFHLRHTESGVEFDCGTGKGLDLPTRAQFWANPPISEIHRIRSKPFPTGEKPRQPIWIGRDAA